MGQTATIDRSKDAQKRARAWFGGRSEPVWEIADNNRNPAGNDYTGVVANLDPLAYIHSSPPHTPAGRAFSQMLLEVPTGTPPPSGPYERYLPSVSPILARSLVSYRENRPVDGQNAHHDFTG